MEIRWIEQTGSTNSYLKERLHTMEPLTFVFAKEQTAGRGQRGNSWEAEPGKNLTFSLNIKPEISPKEQFAISEAAALGIVTMLQDHGIHAMVKWPNDIYAGDKKICGILIENSVMGTEISRSVIGVGLNVNQTVFLSDAPNPVSMKMITGKGYDLKSLAREIASTMAGKLELLRQRHSLHKEYMARLWRGDGRSYPFKDNVTGETFEGKIKAVELSGHLLLDDGQKTRQYAFKEVTFL